MLEDLLENKVIELPESKRPGEAGRTTDPKYRKYHRVVSHPLEKRITLKEKIIRLAEDGKIVLYLDDAAESNLIAAMVNTVSVNEGEVSSSSGSGKQNKLSAILEMLPVGTSWQKIFTLPEEARQQLSTMIQQPEL